MPRSAQACRSVSPHGDKTSPKLYGRAHISRPRRVTMPVLFISHSSRDDAQADALAAWLNNHGFTDIFSDHDSIVGGDKWREALRASANACRVVIFLVTADWLASSKCFGEFEASWLMGKRVIPAVPSAGAGHAGRRGAEKACDGERRGSGARHRAVRRP